MSIDSLKLSDAIAEQCCCSICEGYLSCGPIRVLPDGSSICGNCTPENPDISVCRDLVFEKVLSMVSFPCHFRQHGCSERVLFGQITDHESKCSYRIFACPASCSWEGISLKLYDHFMEEHSELIKKNAEIKLQIAERKEGTLMVAKGTITFIIDYLYDCNTNNFKYIIAYLPNHSEYEVSFKINLISAAESECIVNQKLKKCLVFDEGFYDGQNAAVLNLKEFYGALDYPDSLVILINLIVAQTGTNVQSHDLLKCAKCCNYLIPPLFDLENDVLCCDCGKNNSTCTPSNNKEILKLVTEVKFPCRWRNCDFMGKSDIYKAHELSCKFYMHSCLYTCDDCFILSDAVAHYQNSHNSLYLIDKIVCKILFSKTYNIKFTFIIKNNTIIFLRHQMVEADAGNTFQMIIFSSNPDVITGTINFEHQHCTLKAKPFKFVSFV